MTHIYVILFLNQGWPFSRIELNTYIEYVICMNEVNYLFELQTVLIAE